MPSYDKLFHQLEAANETKRNLEREIDRLRSENERLRRRIAALERAARFQDSRRRGEQADREEREEEEEALANGFFGH